MFDTVEIPLDGAVYFQKPVAEVIDAMRAPSPEVRFSSSKHYRAVVDLRQYTGQDAFLHLYSKNSGSHKIQFIETGTKTKGELLDTIAGIVQAHPEMLATSRVDACANVPDVSVAWFARSVRAQRKQWQAQFEKVFLEDANGRRFDLSHMGKRQLQSVYLGTRPNCFRMYDKLEERRQAYVRDRRRHEREASVMVAEKCLEPVPWANVPRDLRRGYARRLVDPARRMFPFPAFEDWFASQCTGGMTGVLQMELPGQQQPEQLQLSPKNLVVFPRVLTRVERQMGAGRVPERIGTVEKLFKNALEFNPFENLEFIPADCEPVFDPSDFSPVEQLAGFQILYLMRSGEMSYQQMYSFLNLRRNGKRIVKKFSPFLAAASPERRAAVTAAELYESYRDTVSRQLAA